MSRPTISVCVIVRDEADLIGRSLSAAVPLADEIVVGDTGSIDETAAVARRFGARVVPIAWREDFSAARNACLDAARSEWVLFVDADEVLERLPGRALRDRLARCEAPAFSVEIVTRHGWRSRETEHATRLVRRIPDHRFAGRVCEDILPSVRRALAAPGWVPPRSGLRILHAGPRADAWAARFAGLIEKELRARPDDPALRLALAESTLRAIGGDLLDTRGSRRALAVLAPAVERLAREPADLLTDPVMALGVRLAVATGDHRRARRWSAAAVRRLGPTARWAYAEGERLLDLAARGRAAPRKAAERFAAAGTAREGSPSRPTPPPMRRAWPRARAAVCRLLAAGPDAPAPPASGTEPVERLLVAAWVRARRRGPLAALPALVELAGRDRGDPRAPWAHAMALQLAGRRASARAMLRAVRDAAPDWAPVDAWSRGALASTPAGLLAPWYSLAS